MNITPTIKSLTSYRGDSVQFTATMLDADAGNTPVNLTGVTATFTAKRTTADPDTSSVAEYKSTDPSPNVTLATPTNGTVTVHVPSAATMGLPQGYSTSLVWDLHVVLTDGSRWTIAAGTWTVNPSVLAS